MSLRKTEIEQWLQNELAINIEGIEPASSDASFRGYWRIQTGTKSQIVMDAPPDKEPIQDFVRIGKALHALSIHVPAMQAIEHDRGFILMEDLGAESYLSKLNEASADKLYGDAITALIAMQLKWQDAELPSYDTAMMKREIALFFDWLIEKHLSITLSSTQKNMFDEMMDTLVIELQKQPTAFVHRDYHSRNLMVCEPNNPGVIDFQDAVIGPVTYDLVSLLRDCYICWPEDQVEKWARQYYDKTNSNLWEENVAWPTFKQWFDWMGIQRHLKASGIFARLYLRDGKDGYLNDIPLTLSYIVSVGKNYDLFTPLVEFIECEMLPRLK